MKYTIPLIFILILSSCFSESDETEGDTLLARVYDSNLYLSDLKGFSENQQGGEDSLSYLESKVNEWIYNEVLFYNGQNELRNLDDIEEKVDAYRKSLVKIEFQEKLIKNKGITVTEDELDEYYTNNSEIFVAEKPIYHVQYVELPEETQNIAKLEKLLNQDSIPHFVFNYCKTYPEKCHFEENFWLYDNQLINKLKLPSYLHNEYPRFRIFEREDNTHLIFKISEKRNKGDILPLALVKDKIYQILVFKKRKEILREIEDNIYIQELNKGNIELHF